MRKEKYITERKSARTGKVSLRVMIQYTDEYGDRVSYNAGTVRVEDYATPGEAMKAAKFLRDEALNKIRRNTIVKHTLTVDELFGQLRELNAWSLGTYEHRKKQYELLVPEKMRHKPIDKIVPAEIQTSINEYAETHSSEYVRKAVALWRLIYKAAALNGIAVYDATNLITRPKGKAPVKHREIVISTDDLHRFLDWLSEYRPKEAKAKCARDTLLALIPIQYYTGCRPGEGLALTVDSISFTREMIYIDKTVGSSTTAFRQIVPTKTAKSKRSVPMPHELMELLQSLVDDAKAEGRTLLLPFVDGLPWSTTYLSARVAELAGYCGIKFNLYMLRHMFSRDMIKSNVNPKVVQDLMGHTTFNMSMYYAYTTEDDRVEAINSRKDKMA